MKLIAVSQFPSEDLLIHWLCPPSFLPFLGQLEKKLFTYDSCQNPTSLGIVARVVEFLPQWTLRTQRKFDIAADFAEWHTERK
jgi:hypothetical protein